MMKQHPHHPAACRELFPHLSEYLDKELDQDAIESVEQHLGQCGCCRICLDTLKQTIAFCSGLPAPYLREAFSLQLRQVLAQVSASSEK